MGRRSRWPRRGLLAAPASLACVAVLTSCYPVSGGITLSAEEVQIPRCSGIESVNVEALQDPGLFDECEPIDVPVVFPDGFTLTIEEYASSTGSTSSRGNEPGPEYGLDRLGVYGMVASFTAPGETTRRWGTPVGLCLVSGMEDEHRDMTSSDCL